MGNTPNIRFKGFTDDWEQRKLGDYCDMYNGDRSSKYPNAQDMVVEGIPFINAGDLENGHVNLTTCNKISREKYDDLGGAKLQLGDIVYCLRGTLGKNAYIDNFPEGTVASSLVAIRPKNIDGRYLFHVLNSDIEYRQRVVHDEGAAQPNLSAKSVSGFMIPIPHIDEQKKVSEYFDNLDNLITLHQRKCDETKILKKFMLQKMFPKNGEKKPEIRFEGFTDDWEQRKLGDIAIITAGGTPSTKKISYWEPKEIPWLASGEVHKKYVYDTDEMISEEGLKNSSAKWVEKGSVLIALAGQGKTRGTAAITRVPITTNQSIAAIKFDSILDADYAFHNLDGRYEELRNISSGDGTRGGLNKQLLSDLEIMFPTIDEQIKIGQYFTELDNLITLHQRKCDEIKEIKKFMLQNMFPQKG